MVFTGWLQIVVSTVELCFALSCVALSTKTCCSTFTRSTRWVSPPEILCTKSCLTRSSGEAKAIEEWSTFRSNSLKNSHKYPSLSIKLLSSLQIFIGRCWQSEDPPLKINVLRTVLFEVFTVIIIIIIIVIIIIIIIIMMEDCLIPSFQSLPLPLRRSFQSQLWCATQSHIWRGCHQYPPPPPHRH